MSNLQTNDCPIKPLTRVFSLIIAQIFTCLLSTIKYFFILYIVSRYLTNQHEKSFNMSQ